jgi:prephenate dehydrogenase
MAIIDAALPALEQCPDGVFVEVTDPGEHVLVAKVGGSIVIDVNDADDIVHVSVPLRAAESAIHEIARANQPM